jgi:hypothetical protein
MTRAVLAIAFLLIGAPAAGASELPMVLPGDATASAVRADPDTWLVGAVPGERSAAVARRFGASHFGFAQTGGYEVTRSRARGFAAALKARGLLVYAEPNVLRRRLAAASDPLSKPDDWRARVAPPQLTPPPVAADSPLIALVDAEADLSHPEWTGDSNISALPGRPVTNPHGTATAAVAVAPQNGIGIVGVWPGARALNVPLAIKAGTEGEITCKASGNAIAQAVEAGADVINMSYGSPSQCASEWVQIYFAVARGIIPVAAAGNEFESGNPLEFPASLPHVVTVAATTADDRSASFSNANNAIDLSAPGVGILTAVPPALDGDGAQDGYEALDGTSFSAPMVSAAMAWVRAARPELEPGRVVQAVRLTARDVGRPGWDPLTGFGVLSVANALAVPEGQLPIHDPHEPNDNLAWVNGTLMPRAQPIWSGGRTVRLGGLLDKQEDKVDVYRIIIPGGRSAKIAVTPRFGDPALDVYSATGFSVNQAKGRVGRSRRAGSKRTERLTIVNSDSAARSYYVAIRPQGNSRFQEREYLLRIS